MLFPEFKFVFIFFPVLYFIFYILHKLKKTNWLVFLLLTASIIFYGLPNWSDFYIIIASILVNYFCYKQMHSWPGKEKLVLYLGVTFNLLLIAYFKYSFFIANNFSYLTGVSVHFEKFILPVGISFYTFQQIAFLMDCYHEKDINYNFKEYALFVSFFPQLIAGPIVHHKELMPQLKTLANKKLSYTGLSLGLVIFIFGVFKKLVLADNFAPLSDTVFNSFDNGIALDFVSSWMGAISYSLQLYFDFSAYSDMAVGLGLVFGISLPINFNSPYKATSIIDFWRRWHITLSNFLRDYLYIPLGGNRKGRFRRYVNLLLTMLIGGLWHGAGWGFILWGGIHGLYLIINHAYLKLNKKISISIIPSYFAILLTLFFVTVAWVFFRAETIFGAFLMFKSMFCFNSNAIEHSWSLIQFIFVLMGLFVVLALPNTLQFFKYNPLAKSDHDLSQFSLGQINFSFVKQSFAVVVGIFLAVALMYMPQQTVFIYFNF